MVDAFASKKDGLQYNSLRTVHSSSMIKALKLYGGDRMAMNSSNYAAGQDPSSSTIQQQQPNVPLLQYVNPFLTKLPVEKESLEMRNLRQQKTKMLALAPLRSTSNRNFKQNSFIKGGTSTARLHP